MMRCTGTAVFFTADSEPGKKGQLDTQYMDGLCISEEDIRRSVRKTLDEMAPGGSYIALFALKTPGRNAVVVDEIKRYSGRFYSHPRPDAL